MPSVYRRVRKDGSLTDMFTADIWVDGKKFSRSTGCSVRRAAEKTAARLEVELRQQLARRHDPLTLDTCMGRYWAEHAGRLPSAKSVKYHILRLLEIMGRDTPLAELSNANVHNYVLTRSKMPVSRTTNNRELDVLQSAYCMARDRWEHPVRAIRWRDHRFPPDDKREATLNIAEAKEAIRLATTKSKDVADAIELTIYTGVRKNELQTLIPARVRLAERKMCVLAKRKARQGYRERWVSLSTAAVALLSERLAGLADDAPLFDLTNHRKIWEWVRVRIGRPEVRWHDLRHTHGTLLGKTTDNTRIIQKQLGHSHIQTSTRYIHTEDAQVLEAVETIPPLTERKMVAARPEVEIQPEPPAHATNIKVSLPFTEAATSANRQRHPASV